MQNTYIPFAALIMRGHLLFALTYFPPRLKYSLENANDYGTCAQLGGVLLAQVTLATPCRIELIG